jgi:1,4-alpha-glucan branching enzyme
MCASITRFSYRPGLNETVFSNVRLTGSWDADGRSSVPWSTAPMAPGIDPDGRPCFEAEVAFADGQVGVPFRWGVVLDGPAGRDLWGIASEVDDEQSTAREQSFVLQNGLQNAVYYLTHCGRLGAIRLAAGLRFSVWAPNAQAVDLILADKLIGYVADNGTGMVKSIAMTRGEAGIWALGPLDEPMLADFANLTGAAYMFRITKDDGSRAFRTDLFARAQIGTGDFDPQGAAYAGPPSALDGPPSCSVVEDFEGVDEEFWRDEVSKTRPVPTRMQDLVIYELHVGALGYGKPDPGTLDDAIALIDYLVDLGVNAVELMPMAEFEDKANWGYGTSHFFAIDQAAGGTARMQAFVKACHQRGIAVILDVCYNHFDPDGERIQWAYDSNDPVKNIYFWYEGRPTDYADPTGGYIDNLSSGWAPRYDEEMVRQLFISSAAWLVTTCHVDGFRLDQTSSIHQYPVIHANGQAAGRAAAFGTKFLKQWTRTMRLLKPGLFLTAEDYSNWSALTTPSLGGDGLGFDSTWYGDFHHNLVEYKGGSYAELVKQSGYGDARPLSMTSFAGALQASSGAKVVYNESHDDCGNRDGSARTLWLAVNGAALVGDTRRWGEARVRVAAALTLLSAGTPMFFMGEEVGAAKFYRYNDFLANREDLISEAKGDGARLFHFYQDLIRFSEQNAAIRSSNIAVTVSDNENRVIAFHRWDETNEFLVVGCLGNTPFQAGYRLHDDRLGSAKWTEIFNSDAQVYGGWNIGNAGATLTATGNALDVVIPAVGLIVLSKAVD